MSQVAEIASLQAVHDCQSKSHPCILLDKISVANKLFHDAHRREESIVISFWAMSDFLQRTTFLTAFSFRTEN